mmetsp:Transcript_7545/g.10407  ORF Transcript_7545/g.10407 Transcript_7545/m.10407 type:complete len:231 (+) Transcript_7545:162-854(+)
MRCKWCNKFFIVNESKKKIGDYLVHEACASRPLDNSTEIDGSSESSKNFSTTESKRDDDNVTELPKKADSKKEDDSVAKLPAKMDSTASNDTKKLEKIVELFEGAIEGNPSKEYELGTAYESGQLKDISKNQERAVAWYLKAAEHGCVESQYKLGVFNIQGLCGLDGDYEQAFHWFQKAADQNHTDAQYNLGSLYEYGTGVEKDRREAQSWYQKAANNGHKGALRALQNL